MKKAFYFWMLLASPLAFAAPRLTCNEAKINLGNAETGTKVKHTFVLRNEGDTPLIIENVKAGCGCTTTQLPENTIDPGESVGLEATLDLTMRRGLQTKWIDIYSNDGGQTNAPFRVEMEVMATDPFRIDPETHVLGQIPIGKSLERRTRISRVDGGTFEIKGVRSSQNNSTSRWEVVEAGKAYDIVTTLLTEGKSGHFFENTLVDINHPALPFLSIQFVANVSAPFHFAPAQIVLHPGPGIVSQTVTVRSGQVSQFKLLGGEWPDRSVNIEVLEPLRIGQQIRISGIKPNPAWNGKVFKIRTDNRDSPEIEIPIRVEAGGS